MALLNVIRRWHLRQEASKWVQLVMTSYFTTRDALEPISREELLIRLKKGVVTPLDMRPKDEFSEGSFARRHQYPFDAARSRTPRTAENQRDHRVLPGALLRLFR